MKRNDITPLHWRATYNAMKASLWEWLESSYMLNTHVLLMKVAETSKKYCEPWLV